MVYLHFYTCRTNIDSWAAVHISDILIPKVCPATWRPLCSGPYKLTYSLICLNLSPPGQSGRHFAGDILKCIFLNEFFCILFEFHWSLFLSVELTTGQHWFMEWFGADQVVSHYLNQCWPSWLTHICGTRGRWAVSKPTVYHALLPVQMYVLLHSTYCQMWRIRIKYDVQFWVTRGIQP